MPENNEIISKLPPQNLEAEIALLGALMIDKDAIIKVADIINEEDFYKEAHGKIYAAMRELFARNEPIDILSLSNRLEEKKQLEIVGGRSYLAKLSASVATASHVVNYANIIQRKATLRRLLHVAAEISEDSFQEEDNVDDILDKAEQKLFNVSQRYLRNVFLPIDTLLAEAFERIDELHKQGKKTTIFEIITFPLFKFIFSYFLKFGFLDGPAGFVYSFFMSFHSFLVRIKLYQKYVL